MSRQSLSHGRTRQASRVHRRRAHRRRQRHILGVGASLVAATALMIAALQLPPASIVSLAVYGFGLIAVFACSAAYHLATERRLKALLRRFDHAAIYVKIAGTYTPFAAIKMGDAAGFALLAAVWAITAFGATAKLLWPGRLVRTSYVLYLAQGWAIVAAFGSFASAVSGRVLVLLVVGGVHLHARRRLPPLGEAALSQRHLARLRVAASACHFAAIVDAVVFAASA